MTNSQELVLNAIGEILRDNPNLTVAKIIFEEMLEYTVQEMTDEKLLQILETRISENQLLKILQNKGE